MKRQNAGTFYYGCVHAQKVESHTDLQRQQLLEYASSQGFAFEDILLLDDTKAKNLVEKFEKLNTGDTLVVTDLTYLGQDIFTVLNRLNNLLSKGIKLLFAKNEFPLDQIKQVAAFSDLLTTLNKSIRSRTTKDALYARKMSGVKLGRRVGAKNHHVVLDDRKYEIKKLLEQGLSISRISRKLDVDVGTVNRLLKRHPELKEMTNA